MNKGSKMKFYYIKPKEKLSYSRRWYADEKGLIEVEKKYRNYSKDPENIVDRWDEFKASETKDMFYDFGGMMRIGTPEVSEDVMGVKIGMPVTHIDYFIMATERNDLSKDGIWQCPARFVCGVFSYEFRDAAREVFQSKQKLYEEMIEGFNKDMDAAIGDAMKNGRLISLKKYHNK